MQAQGSLLQDSNATYTFHLENILMTAVPCVHKSNLLVFAFSYAVTFSSPLVKTVRDLAEVFVVLDTERIAMEKVDILFRRFNTKTTL